MIWKFRQLYQLVINSVAFTPSIISTLFLVLSLLVLNVEGAFFSSFIKENLGVLLVDNTSNARELLSALTTGMISLTVFSFSTVMVVIKQASSQFTPRVLPGFLGDQKNQFILGFYIGTIVYCIIQVLHVESKDISFSTQFGVMLALVFGIASMGLFIYFVHLIFLKIQLDYLIPSASVQATESINKEGRATSVPVSAQNLSETYSLRVKELGYLNEINEKSLNKVCRKHKLQVVMLQPLGTFLLTNQVICRVSRSLEGNKKLKTKLLECFILSNEPFGEKTYLYGLNQISEMAIKALSPAVNDPGTAMICLDYLSNVFCCLLQNRQYGTGNQGRQKEHYVEKQLSLEKLLFSFIVPIGKYGESDARVHLKMLDFYDRLLAFAGKEEAEIIKKFIAAEKESISGNIESDPEKEILEDTAKAIDTNRQPKAFSLGTQ